MKTKLIILGAIVIGLVIWVVVNFGKSPKAENIVISSDDGNLELTIVPDALPDNVQASAIKITKQEPSDLPAELMAFANGPAYRLEPDGLVFNEPIPISFKIDTAVSEDNVTGYMLLTQSTGGEIEPLQEMKTEADLASDSMQVSGKLSHFSWLTASKLNLEVGLTQIEPKKRVVGDQWQINYALLNKPLNPNITGADPGFKEIKADIYVREPMIMISAPRARKPLEKQNALDVFDGKEFALGPTDPGFTGPSYEALIGCEKTSEAARYAISPNTYSFGVITIIDWPAFPRLHNTQLTVWVTASAECSAAPPQTANFSTATSTPLPPGTFLDVPIRIKVIKYQDKYLPVDQLVVESEKGCGTDHWHAKSGGVVIATDGSKVPDPGPQCGYGKVAEVPAILVEKP